MQKKESDYIENQKIYCDECKQMKNESEFDYIDEKNPNVSVCRKCCRKCYR